VATVQQRARFGDVAFLFLQLLYFRFHRSSWLHWHSRKSSVLEMNFESCAKRSFNLVMRATHVMCKPYLTVAVACKQHKLHNHLDPMSLEKDAQTFFVFLEMRSIETAFSCHILSSFEIISFFIFYRNHEGKLSSSINVTQSMLSHFFRSE
jgi:predicted nucleic acid-binding Zn finger protein